MEQTGKGLGLGFLALASSAWRAASSRMALLESKVNNQVWLSVPGSDS